MNVQGLKMKTYEKFMQKDEMILRISIIATQVKG